MKAPWLFLLSSSTRWTPSFLVAFCLSSLSLCILFMTNAHSSLTSCLIIHLLLPFSSTLPLFSQPFLSPRISWSCCPLRASVLLTLYQTIQGPYFSSFLLHRPHPRWFLPADQTCSLQSQASFTRWERFIPHTCSHQGLGIENIKELPISGILADPDNSNVNRATKSPVLYVRTGHRIPYVESQVTQSLSKSSRVITFPL